MRQCSIHNTVNSHRYSRLVTIFFLTVYFSAGSVLRVMGRRWQGSKKPLRVMNFDATGNVCTGAKLTFASECCLMESSGILRRATSLNESVANNIPPPSICTCVCARVSMCLDEGRRVWHRHRGFLWASFPWILSAADSRERVRQYARKPRDGCQDTVVPQLCRIRLYIYTRLNYFFKWTEPRDIFLNAILLKLS